MISTQKEVIAALTYLLAGADGDRYGLADDFDADAFADDVEDVLEFVLGRRQ